MPAIDNLLKRFGFVRLANYGLVLTPEGRIMSLRPAILDDGLGGRIVGWPDGDLAAMELQKWEPAKPAPARAVATRVAAPPPIPRAIPKTAVAVALVVPTAAVAEPPQVEEDDWEWEIALARARVAAEEAEQAAQLAVRSRRRNTVPPPIAAAAKPKLVVQIPPLDHFEEATKPSSEIVQIARLTERPVASRERPQATPIGVRRISIPPKTQPIAVAPPPTPTVVQTRPKTSPPTVIPIPRLPSIKQRTAQIQPVVSSAAPARTRFAKGTGPVVGTHVGVAPPPPIRSGEDDKTSPGIGLPSAARAVALPSIKRLSR